MSVGCSISNVREEKLCAMGKMLYEIYSWFYVDIDAINFILQGIPNDIYNFVNACQDAKAMRKRVKRLIERTDLSEQERYSRITDEFDKFSTGVGESLESIYERFSRIVNNMPGNKLLSDPIAINIKFLNSLQPE
ncbi:hypothetical protein Tco_0948283 [Tanacetum coccineum]